MRCLRADQFAKPYSRASTNCASVSPIRCLSGSAARTRARASGSPRRNDASSSLASFFCCSRSARAGSVRRNADMVTSFVSAGVRTSARKRSTLSGSYDSGGRSPFRGPVASRTLATERTKLPSRRKLPDKAVRRSRCASPSPRASRRWSARAASTGRPPPPHRRPRSTRWRRARPG